MHVDRELVEHLVVQILGQLAAKRDIENIFILGSKDEAAGVSLPKIDGVAANVHYSDEALIDVNGFDRYILPRLEMDDMADLAHGKATSARAREVLGYLLKGKTVEVYRYAYKDFEDSASPGLYQLYCGYAESLSGFGLCPLQEQVQKTTRVNAGVISERDVERYNAEGVRRIGISDKALVTSLAEECAKKFGIEIQRDKRGA